MYMYDVQNFKHYKINLESPVSYFFNHLDDMFMEANKVAKVHNYVSYSYKLTI